MVGLREKFTGSERSEESGGRSSSMSTEIKTPLNWYTGGGADTDVDETEEWLSALEEVVDVEGHERGQFLLRKLLEKGYEKDISLPFTANTPYINTIAAGK